MIALDIKYRQERLEQLQRMSLSGFRSEEEQNRIDQQIQALDPANTAIEDMVSAPLQKPDGSFEVPTAFRFRHSEGQSYMPGALVVEDGVVTSSVVLNLPEAPGAFGAHPDAQSALKAAERVSHGRQAAQQGITPEQPVTARPASDTTPTI